MHTRLSYKSQDENLGNGEFTRESQIALGAWENTSKDQGGAIPRSMNSGWPKLPNGTRVSITMKTTRELHELAQYLRKIPINTGQWE